MKKSQHSDKQIVQLLRESEVFSGTLQEFCREKGITYQTLNRWKKKFGSLGVSEIKRIKQIEKENNRLKRLVAEQALEITILKEINEKKW